MKVSEDQSGLKRATRRRETLWTREGERRECDKKARLELGWEGENGGVEENAKMDRQKGPAKNR